MQEMKLSEDQQPMGNLPHILDVQRVVLSPTQITCSLWTSLFHCSLTQGKPLWD